MRLSYDFRWKMELLWECIIGMKLALWLEKIHPDWCWADICVNVGLGKDVLWLWRVPDEQKAEDARTVCIENDCAKNGSCWCGKMMTPEFRAQWEKDKVNQ